MSKFKGGSPLEAVALTFVVGGGIFLVILLLYIFNIGNIIKIRGDVDIVLKMEDEGSSILGFLNAKKGEYTNAEVMGMFEATNMPPELSRQMDETLATYKNYYVKAKSSGELVKKSGEPPASTLLKSTIPMPGGKTGYVEMITWQ